MRIVVASWFDKEALLAAQRIVSISTSEPKQVGFNPIQDFKLGELVPGWPLVRGYKNGSITEAQYRQQYMDRDRPWDLIEALLKDGDVLCCWCKRGDFCHRLLVAEVLQKRGVEVEIR
jgi:hypothetical protein